MMASTLSRWRALQNAMLGGWFVQAEDKTPAPDPCLFADHQSAQNRADELNRAEMYAAIGEKDPRS